MTLSMFGGAASKRGASHAGSSSRLRSSCISSPVRSGARAVNEPSAHTHRYTQGRASLRHTLVLDLLEHALLLSLVREPLHADLTIPHHLLATALALTSVRSEDRHEFSQLVTAIRQQYNENAKQIERTWGGGIMGCKSQAATAKLERAIAKEAAKKAMM